jgi:phosphoribosyl-ATP pyrophosphohydrolase
MSSSIIELFKQKNDKLSDIIASIIKTKKYRTCGIYAMGIVGTEKIYIGQSCHILTRIKEHYSRLKNKTHCNRYMQGIFDQSNKDILCYIIEECDEINLTSKENEYIQFLKNENIDMLYNRRNAKYHRKENDHSSFNKVFSLRINHDIYMKLWLAKLNKQIKENRPIDISDIIRSAILDKYPTPIDNKSDEKVVLSIFGR